MNKTLNLSVIIPFKNNSEMTVSCVNSLIKSTKEINEVLLINNGSDRYELKKIKNALKSFNNVSILKYNKPFNYQKLNNWASKKTSSSYLMFLNNDIEFVEHNQDLIELMYKKAQKPATGMVGTLLLYENKKNIQHAGVYLQPGDSAKHLYAGEDLRKIMSEGEKNEKYPYRIDVDRPVTAVTAALCIIKKETFFAVEGFDERFTIGGGDVDLCIRLNKKRFQTWYVNNKFIFAIHKEKQTRRNIHIPYSDYFYSYKSYISAFDFSVGDSYLPLKAMK